MGSMNKLSVLLAFSPTAEEEPLSEPFLSPSGTSAEAVSKGRRYASVLRNLGTTLEFFVPWSKMALLCSVTEDVPIERKRDITCGTSCLCW